MYHSQIFCWVNSVLYSIVFFSLHNLENLELNHLFFHVLIKNFILIAWLVWLAYFLQEWKENKSFYWCWQKNLFLNMNWSKNQKGMCFFFLIASKYQFWICAAPHPSLRRFEKKFFWPYFWNVFEKCHTGTSTSLLVFAFFRTPHIISALVDLWGFENACLQSLNLNIYQAWEVMSPPQK